MDSQMKLTRSAARLLAAVMAFVMLGKPHPPDALKRQKGLTASKKIPAARRKAHPPHSGVFSYSPIIFARLSRTIRQPFGA